MAKEKKRLLIIDANSLIHRAFHALPPLSTSKGQMVNAVYGFLLVFFKAIKEFQPEYIAAAFDVAGPTFRDKKFKEYKAKREKAPDELYSQMPLVKEVLAAFHVPVYEKQGFEADDIIGTIAKLAPKRQVHPALETIIVSGDMDALQLVNKHTKVYTMRKSIQDSVLYGESQVEKRFAGIKPSQLADWKGLRGDASDNIPGVKGIGEKTASQLLSDFGSLDRLYGALKKKKKIEGITPRIHSILLEETDKAFLSRDLATIDTNVPIEFRLQDLAWQKFDKEKIEELLKTFQFHSLIKRLDELVSGKESNKGEKKDETAEKIERLYQDGVFSLEVYELEKELSPVLRSMEEIGVKIDKKHFAQLKKEIEKELLKLEKGIFKAAGISFNINSPQQLSEVLFEKLSLSTKGLHKTPGGAVSTASPELEKLQGVHAVIPQVLGYRELAKLHNTYIVPLPLLADKKERVHTSFDQLGAATGRLSSSSPNLQNIPVLGEWGKRIRQGFVAEKGYQFVSFDYSQVELRIAAAISKEEKMQEFFRKEKDIHKETAATVFGVAQNKVTPEMRQSAKALNFGILYGMGARGFAQSAKIPFEEAQDFIENYFVQFPNIARYIEETKEFARENGYVETLLGRKRYIPDIISHTPQLRAAAERAAINHPVQGFASDIIKTAMVKISKEVLDKNPKCRLLLQIHDELLFEISNDILKKLIPQIKSVMEETCQLSVSLVVQVKAGDNWKELTPTK